MEYVRVSASYLFNIQLDNYYLLIKSERRNQYQPIGGCFKYFPNAEEFLLSIGAIPEKKSNGIDSLMDIRLLIPTDSINAFIKWYISGQNRETTYDREFNEELVSVLPQEKQNLFNKIRAEKLLSGSFDIFFDEEKEINSIKPMDIISIDLTSEQKQVVRDFCSHNSNLILATETEIMNGYKTLKDNRIIKIGGHTKNILRPPFQTMEL